MVHDFLQLQKELTDR